MVGTFASPGRVVLWLWLLRLGLPDRRAVQCSRVGDALDRSDVNSMTEPFDGVGTGTSVVSGSGGSPVSTDSGSGGCGWSLPWMEDRIISLPSHKWSMCLRHRLPSADELGTTRVLHGQQPHLEHNEDHLGSSRLMVVWWTAP